MVVCGYNFSSVNISAGVTSYHFSVTIEEKVHTMRLRKLKKIPHILIWNEAQSFSG